MLHPELRYDLARHEHQARIDAAARKRELRAVRQEQRGRWLAAVGARLRNVRRAGVQAPVSAETSASSRVSVVTGQAQGAAAI
jgi:hypothetical protein